MSDYRRELRRPDGLRSSCFVCQKKWRKEYYARTREESMRKTTEWRLANPERAKSMLDNYRRTNVPRLMVKSARDRSKKRGLPFDLTIEFMEHLLKQGHCCYCTAPIVSGRVQQGRSLDSASMDRVHPESGYTQANVRLACVRCNQSKSDMDYKSWRDYILRLSEQLVERPEAPVL